MITGNNEQTIVNLLVSKGNDFLNTPFKPVAFTKNPVIDKNLNDLDNYPHLFVLACVMDSQIKAERAWKIPYYVSEGIDNPEFKYFSDLTLSEIQKRFQENKLHRFNNKMAVYFYKAVQKIKKDYKGDASLIWKDNYSCDVVIQRFLQFEGVGLRIATMAANSLLREFKKPMKNRSSIDLIPDVHVKTVFTRLGFISKDSTNNELIIRARALYPEYPGILDLPTWEIGREWCKPSDPDCSSCYLTPFCRKSLL